ncbi:hypothetical protein ACFQH8_06790 [Halomicroarcula sp. GCM10025710]
MGTERTYLKDAPEQSTEISKEVRDSVYDILSQIREEQDEAIRTLTAKFDGVEPTSSASPTRRSRMHTSN